MDGWMDGGVARVCIYILRVVVTGSARAMLLGTSVPGKATQGGLVWHPAVFGPQPS